MRVNCEAMVRLSRLFVPRMVERRRGWVLVVASTASFQPMPYLATYAATKVFDRFFALGLAAEVARYGVKVTALCPGRRRASSLTWPAQGSSSGAARSRLKVWRGWRSVRWPPAREQSSQLQWQVSGMHGSLRPGPA